MLLSNNKIILFLFRSITESTIYFQSSCSILHTKWAPKSRGTRFCSGSSLKGDSGKREIGIITPRKTPEIIRAEMNALCPSSPRESAVSEWFYTGFWGEKELIHGLWIPEIRNLMSIVWDEGQKSEKNTREE